MDETVKNVHRILAPKLQYLSVGQKIMLCKQGVKDRVYEVCSNIYEILETGKKPNSEEKFYLNIMRGNWKVVSEYSTRTDLYFIDLYKIFLSECSQSLSGKQSS